MKRIRGIKMVIAGILFYIPCFIWSQVSEQVPVWLFRGSVVIFLICFFVGLFQILTNKDEVLDDDLMQQIGERREKAAKRGMWRLGR